MLQKAEEEAVRQDAELAQRRSQGADWVSKVAALALVEVKQELERHGRDARTSSNAQGASIEVHYKGRLELRYSILLRTFPTSVHSYPEVMAEDRTTGRTYKAEGYLRSGAQDYTIEDITKDEIIQHFLQEYRHRFLKA